MNIQQRLEKLYAKYNNIRYFADDPVMIPRQFSRKEDIEISGFFAALFAWGNRKTAKAKAMDLMKRMNFKPHHYVTCTKDFRNCNGFAHRTIRSADVVFLLRGLRQLYAQYGSMEDFFSPVARSGGIKDAIHSFRNFLLSEKHALYSERHLSEPYKNSGCKRMNLFLRWMVRHDNVDMGVWQSVDSSALYMPLDVHSGRMSRSFGLLSRKNDDWNAVEELTQRLRTFDSRDPVKYDIALFGAGFFMAQKKEQ